MTKLLIVEDDADYRHELSDYLSSRGYEVLGVGLMAEAELALQREFALLLIDIRLPDGCVAEFCMRMRPYVRAGIVLMTGASERQLRIQGLKGGADGYLQKPVDPEELDATLQSVLRRVVAQRGPFAVAPLPVQWRVDRARRTLLGPNARVCKLSQAEVVLLVSLVRAKGQQMSRADLMASFEAHGLAISGRRLEALISRLRGKVMDEMRLTLPIQPQYGQGYIFSDHAQNI